MRKLKGDFDFVSKISKRKVAFIKKIIHHIIRTKCEQVPGEVARAKDF